MAFSQLLRRRNHRIHVVVPSKTDKEVVPISWFSPSIFDHPKAQTRICRGEFWNWLLKLVAQFAARNIKELVISNDFNIGPNFEGVQSTNKIALPNLKLPPEEKNWSSNQTDERRFVFITTHGGRLPLAEFASWADAGDDDDGPTVVFLELGLRCFFFLLWHFGEVLFETGILHLVSLGFLGGGGLNCAFYVFIFLKFSTST